MRRKYGSIFADVDEEYALEEYNHDTDRITEKINRLSENHIVLINGRLPFLPGVKPDVMFLPESSEMVKQRMRKRKTDSSFIRFISQSFDESVAELKKQCDSIITLDSNSYLSGQAEMLLEKFNEERKEKKMADNTEALETRKQALDTAKAQEEAEYEKALQALQEQHEQRKAELKEQTDQYNADYAEQVENPRKDILLNALIAGGTFRTGHGMIAPYTHGYYVRTTGSRDTIATGGNWKKGLVNELYKNLTEKQGWTDENFEQLKKQNEEIFRELPDHYDVHTYDRDDRDGHIASGYETDGFKNIIEGRCGGTYSSMTTNDQNDLAVDLCILRGYGADYYLKHQKAFTANGRLPKELVEHVYRENGLLREGEQLDEKWCRENAERCVTEKYLNMTQQRERIVQCMLDAIDVNALDAESDVYDRMTMRKNGLLYHVAGDGMQSAEGFLPWDEAEKCGSPERATSLNLAKTLADFGSKPSDFTGSIDDEQDRQDFEETKRYFHDKAKDVTYAEELRETMQEFDLIGKNDLGDPNYPIRLSPEGFEYEASREPYSYHESICGQLDREKLAQCEDKNERRRYMLENIRETLLKFSESDSMISSVPEDERTPDTKDEDNRRAVEIYHDTKGFFNDTARKIDETLQRESEAGRLAERANRFLEAHGLLNEDINKEPATSVGEGLTADAETQTLTGMFDGKKHEMPLSELADKDPDEWKKVIEDEFGYASEEHELSDRLAIDNYGEIQATVWHDIGDANITISKDKPSEVTLVVGAFDDVRFKIPANELVNQPDREMHQNLYTRSIDALDKTGTEEALERAEELRKQYSREFDQPEPDRQTLSAAPVKKNIKHPVTRQDLDLE